MPVNTVSGTYTSPQGAIASNQMGLAKQFTSSVQGSPPPQAQPVVTNTQPTAPDVDIRTLMGEQAMQQEGVLPVLAGERGNIIRKLFEADQQIAQKYGTQNTPEYIEDPMARQRMVDAQQSTLYGALGEVDALIGARSKVLGDSLDKGMKLLEYGLKATSMSDDLLKQLTPNELQLFPGVAYGSTRGQVAGLVPMSSKDQEKVATLTQLEKQMARLNEFSQGSTYGNKISANIAQWQLDNLGPVTPELQRIKMFVDYQQGLLSTIARKIQSETGQLNEGDVQRARALLPSLDDTAETRAQKMAMIQSDIDTSWGNVMPGYSKDQIKAIASGRSPNQANYATTPDNMGVTSADYFSPEETLSTLDEYEEVQ